MTQPVRADRPIGVFDSGIGGLTVLRALLAELPHERFIYLGDTARLPYGTKTAETVARYSVQAADALVGLGVKCLVVACNTASSAGLPAIRECVRPVPVIGVIEPGAEAACRATRSGHIAVIATERTVGGGAYQQAILEHRPDARVQAFAAQLFVALAEEGLTEGPLPESVVRHYLAAPFAGAGNAEDRWAGVQDGRVPDTLVLGCTHFPLLSGAIRTVVAPEVRIVDSAETTARAVGCALAAAGIEGRREPADGAQRTMQVRLLATDGAERFARVGGRFLGHAIESAEVELVDL